MDTNKVEINPSAGGVVVTINGAILPGATVVFIDGQRLDFIGGRVVVSTIPPDTPDEALADVAPIRRIAL